MAGTMTTEAKAAKAAYMREWRAKNKERDRANTAAYWQRKADQAAKEKEGGDNGGE